MKTAKPGNWQPLVERYSGNAATQKELGAWLDQYASTADDAAALLDARDSAAEAGIRSDDYHGIAKRLGVKRKK